MSDKPTIMHNKHISHDSISTLFDMGKQYRDMLVEHQEELSKQPVSLDHNYIQSQVIDENTTIRCFSCKFQVSR